MFKRLLSYFVFMYYPFIPVSLAAFRAQKTPYTVHGDVARLLCWLRQLPVAKHQLLTLIVVGCLAVRTLAAAGGFVCTPVTFYSSGEEGERGWVVPVAMQVVRSSHPMV